MRLPVFFSGSRITLYDRQNLTGKFLRLERFFYKLIHASVKTFVHAGRLIYKDSITKFTHLVTKLILPAPSGKINHCVIFFLQDVADLRPYSIGNLLPVRIDKVRVSLRGLRCQMP